MYNKIYAKIVDFIKENYKHFLFVVILFLFLNFPLDYSIYISGGTINVDDRIQIEKECKSKGTFNLSYVSEVKATTITYLLSHIIPSWEMVPLEEERISSNESIEDINKRSKLYLNKSEEDAIKIAYQKANKTFNIVDTKFNVVYISEESDSDLKIGDIILKINNKKMLSIEQYKQEVLKTDVGEYIYLKIKRNDKFLETKIKVNNIEGEKITGISLLELNDYKTTPKIDLTFKESESGSSGGLMLTLAIYDKLIKEDLTNGKKIVGTGTIDEYGNVGEIGGVRYKLSGAVKDGADIFIAPAGNNYIECQKIIKEKKYNIKLIEGKTFEQVLEELKVMVYE